MRYNNQQAQHGSASQTSLTGRKINPERADLIPNDGWNSDYTPNFDSGLKKIDRQGTINDLMQKQINLLEGEAIAQKKGQEARNAQSYIDSYRNANGGINNKTREKNMKTLEDLGVTMDDIRAEYYRRNPTPQMQAREEAGKILNNAFYNTFGPSPVQTAAQSQAINNDAQMQEAKRLVTNELKRMNAAGELTKDISRTKKLIDLYKKLK